MTAVQVYRRPPALGPRGRWRREGHSSKGADVVDRGGVDPVGRRCGSRVVVVTGDTAAGCVVELHDIVGVAVTVPSATRDDDELTAVERYQRALIIVEQFDGDGSG